MLPKRVRLTRELFDEVMDEGKIFHSPILSLKAIKVNSSNKKDGQRNRFAVVASKKYFKTAVLRNKVRRRTYTALAAIMPLVKNMKNAKNADNVDGGAFYGVLMMKSSVLQLDQPRLKQAIHEIFVKSRIIT